MPVGSERNVAMMANIIITKTKIIVYSLFKKAIAPLWTSLAISRILSRPSGFLRSIRNVIPAKSIPTTPKIGTKIIAFSFFGLLCKSEDEFRKQ